MSSSRSEWLREKIEQAGYSNAAFSRKIKVSREHLQRKLNDPVLRIRLNLMWRILKALNLTEAARQRGYVQSRGPAKSSKKRSVDEVLTEKYSVESVFDELIRLDRLGQLSNPPRFEVSTHREFDTNVDDYSFHKLFEIPIFEMNLAAGAWAEVEGVGEGRDQNQFEQGLFRVRLIGDSMHPKYKDGDIVEFKCVRDLAGDLILGREYYVQRNDGMATFKVLASLGEDGIVLHAINSRKYKRPINVSHQEIVQMALAVAKVQLISEGKNVRGKM